MAQVRPRSATSAGARSLRARAVDRVPLPQYVALPRRPLRRAPATAPRRRAQYALIGVIETAARRERRHERPRHRALRRRPRHRDLARTRSTLARKGYVDRPSIFGDDVLGWALARNGRCARGARRTRSASLRLGTKDALKFFHRGWIAACLGRPREAPRAGTGARSRSTRTSRSSGRRSPGRERSREEARRRSLVARRRAARAGRRVRRIRSATSRSTASRASRCPGHRLYVRYVLDLAEIPTYQARQDGRRPARLRAAHRARAARHVDGRARRAACPSRTRSRSRAASPACTRCGSR